MPTILGREIGPTAFGLMRMTWHPEPLDDETAFKILKAALKSGMNCWNSGEFYGNGKDATSNLHIVNRYFTKYPEDADKVVLSVKGAMDMSVPKPDSSPENLAASVDNILRILDGKKSLDLFEPARVDPKVRIEDTVQFLVDKYIKTGKLGGISLTECSANVIRRAAKVHKIACVEFEYSLFSTDIRDNGVLQACKDLDIPIFAYSPNGAGFLTGQIKSLDDLPKNDFRRGFERFQPENFDKNFKLVDKIKQIADKKGVTAAQVALAWCRKQPLVIPLPGTRTVERTVENAKPVELTDEEYNELEEMLKTFTPQGVRYTKGVQHMMYGESA